MSSTKSVSSCHLKFNNNDVNNNYRYSKKDNLRVEEKKKKNMIKIHRLCENCNIYFQLS